MIKKKSEGEKKELNFHLRVSYVIAESLRFSSSFHCWKCCLSIHKFILITYHTFPGFLNISILKGLYTFSCVCFYQVTLDTPTLIDKVCSKEVINEYKTSFEAVIHGYRSVWLLMQKRIKFLAWGKLTSAMWGWHECITTVIIFAHSWDFHSFIKVNGRGGFMFTFFFCLKLIECTPFSSIHYHALLSEICILQIFIQDFQSYTFTVFTN